MGLVGGVPSRAAKAGEVLKTDMGIARIAATLAVRQREMCWVMLYLLLLLRSLKPPRGSLPKSAYGIFGRITSSRERMEKRCTGGQTCQKGSEDPRK